MNKAQAIQIIREEYQNGYSPTDIAQNLCQRLSAPFGLVYQFVMQTLDAEIEPAEEPIPPPAPLAPPESIEPAIPGYETLSTQAPIEPEDPPAETTPAPVFTSAAAPDWKALEQNPKVEKFVVQMLTSNQKSSEAVMAICERTGLSWDEAQRLVSRIAAKNHKMLKARQNRGPLILSLIALSVGGVLIFAGVGEALTIYATLQGTQSGEELVLRAASQEFLRRTFWALVIGGSLLLGGAVGLFMALRNQFE